MSFILPLGFFIASIGTCLFVSNTIYADPHHIRDPIHMYFPRVNYKYLSDILITLQMSLLTFTITKVLLKEFFIVCGIIQFMRAITMSSTILPSLEHHNDKIRLGGLNGRGTEYIFSGHAVYACLSLIYLYKMGIVKLPILIIYNLISQLIIILSRNHYTVDVILSWMITPLVYGNVIQYL